MRRIKGIDLELKNKNLNTFKMNNSKREIMKLKSKTLFFFGLLLSFLQAQGQTLDLGNDQLICAGASSSASITAAANNLGTETISSYAWTIDGVAAASTSSTLSVPASISPINPQVVECTATLSNNTTITDQINVYTIDPGVIAGSQFSCTAPYNPTAFTSTSAGSTALSGIATTYQWQSSTNGTTWTDISGATNATYSHGSTSTSTYFRRAIICTLGSLSVTCYSNELFVEVLQSPSISSNQCISNGNTASMAVSFSTALPSGYTASYSWSGPNSYSNSNATATVSNFGSSNVGTYSASISVSNGTNTCPYTLSTQLNLVPSVPSFTIPSSGCTGTTYSPANFTPQAGVSYLWTVTPTNNSTGLNTSNPTFEFNTGGTYSVSVMATDASGTCTSNSTLSSISIPVFSNIDPSIGIGTTYYNPQVINNVNTIAICAGLSISNVTIYNNNTANNGGTNPAGVSYTYSLNGSSPVSILDDANETIYFGDNSLEIIASYQGCSISNTVNVYSGSNPFVSLGTSNSIGLCPGDALTFTINPVPTSGQLNPPGTSYTMTYSDSPGTTNVFNDLTGPTSVVHNYLLSSCGMSYPGNLYPANTFYAQVTAENYCGSTSSTVSPITVNDDPVADYTITDTTICDGQSITVVNTGNAGSVVASTTYSCSSQGKFYWTISGGTLGVDFTLATGQTLGTYNNTYSNPNGSVNTTGNGSSTLNITFNNPGYYTLTQHYHNGCGTKTKVSHICVIEPPTCQFNTDVTAGCTPLTVAINNTTVAPTCDNSPVPLTYNWTVTAPNGTSASYTSNSSATPPNLTLTNNTAAPQTYTITVTVTPMEPGAPTLPFSTVTPTSTTAACTSTCSQTVLVNPKPVFSAFNLTTCDNPYQVNQNLATSTTLTNNTYSWIANSNTNVDGESTTAQSGAVINDLLTNNYNGPQTVVYNITPTSSLGCVGTTVSSSIILNYVNAGSISSDQTICSGGNPANIAGTLPSGSGTVSYQWQISTDNSTWSNISGATGQSYDPPGPINATTYYRRVVTYASNGVNCTGISNVVIITVNSVSPGTISAAQGICSGDDPAALNIVTAPTGTGTISTIWQQGASTSGPWSSITGQTTSSYDPPALTSTTYYTVLATSVLNGVSCSSTTPAIAITVYTLTPGSISSSQTICEGGDLGAFTSVTASSNATLAYQWQSSTDNINWTNISGATSATYNPPALNTTTYYRRLVNALVGTTVICQDMSNTITITVVADPTVSTPIGQTLCTGGTTSSLTVTASGGISSSYTYQWYNSSNSLVSTSNPYTPPASNNSYYCVVSISPSTTGCSVTSVTAQISIVADPVVTAPTGATYCQDAASVSALSVSASGGLSTSYNYQWYYNTTNSNTGGTLISGATSSTFTPPVNTVGTKYYYCLVTIAPSSTGCSTASSTAAITVTAGPSIASQPANQTRCIGGSFSALSVTSAGGSGSPTYQWYSNTSNSNTGGTLISGATSSSYTPPSNLNTAAGVTYYYCVISFSSTGGCSVISSNAASVTVLATPTLNSMNNQIYCPADVVSASALSGNYPTGMSYVWSVSGASIGLSSTSGSSSSIPAFTAANGGTSPLTATVTVTPSVTQNGQTCAGSPTAAYTITVNPVPDMPAFSPQLFVFCEDEQALVPFSANISSGMTFNWTNDNTQIGVAASGTSTSPGLSFTAENNLSYPNNIPLTSNFYVTPIYTNQGVACPGSPEFFAITVNPKPDVNTVQDITYCATETGYNQFTSFNQITGSGSTSYVWTNTNTAIGLQPSGTGDFYFTSTNTTLVPISGTIAVTPTYTNNGVTCEGDIEEFEITINPMPTVDSISSQGWCLGETTTAVNPTGNLSTAVYNWTNNNTTTGLGPNGVGLIPSFVGLNTTNAPNVSTVSVVPSYTNNNVTCVGATEEFGITINPMPNINPIADQQVCAQYPVSVQFTSTPNVAGTVYNWTNNNPTIGLGALGSGSLSFNATNTTNAPITAEIIVTPSFTFAGSTCTGAPDTFNIVVLPTPVMNPLSDETICAGTPTSILNFSSNLSGTEFSWTNSNNTIGLGLSGSGSSIGSFNGINSGTAPTEGLITVTPSLTTNGEQCFGSPVSATITVNPIPVMNTVNTLSFCYGAAASIPLSSNINTNVSYDWTNNNTEIGLNASGNGSISFSTANPYTTAISGSVTVSPEYSYNNVQCPGNPSTFTIQVAPNPEVNTLSNVDFCSGQQTSVIPISGTVTGATYSWTNANAAIGLTGPGTGNIPVFTATNSSTTSVASSLVTVTPNLSFNGQSCTGPSAQFTISINPGTTINSIPNVQLCNGESSIPINFSGSGSTYSWSSNNQSIGIAGSGNTSIQSFVATNPSTTPIDATITVTSQFTGGSGNGCNGGSTSFNIEVLPTPSVIDPANIVVCHNNAVAAVNLSGVATNYVWTNNTPSIGLTNSGSTATIPGFIATNTGASPVTATVSITPSYVSGTKTCTGTSQNYTITVIPTPTITSQPQSQTVCLGGTLNALSVAYAGGSGTPSYQWYGNTSNSNTGGSPISGATAASYPLGAAASTGINYYYCVMTFANSATCSQLTSEVATISVTNGPSITTQPLSSQSICVGGSISAPLTVGFANGTGNSTFQWYSVVGGTNTPIAGETAIDFMPGVFNTVGTYNYMVQISLSGSGCGVATSNTVQINVLADPTLTSPVDANYCLNSSTAVPLTVVASGGVSVPYTYQWYSNSVSNNTSGTAIAGANAASYIPPATTVGTVYYYCQVNQGNGCSVNSNLAAIEITTAPTISAQPLNTQTVCVDGTLTPLSVNYTNGSGTPQYQWYSNSQNSYIGGVAIPGETNSTYTPSTANTGTIYYYCNISFTQSGCSSISSNISQVIVVADPVITTNPLATQTICSGGTIPAALSVAYQYGTGNVSYQWYSVNNGINSPITGATNANYTPPVYNSAGTFTYAVQVSLSGSGCNQVLSNTAEVIVLPDPSVSNPISATYCNGYTPVAPLSVAAGGGLSGNFDYQWYSNSVNSNSSGQILLGETAPSFTPPVTTNGTVYYYCVVSQGAANTGCLVQSAPAMITTNAAPNFTSQPLGFQEACVGGTLANLTVGYTGGSTNPTYQWYSSATNNNTGGTPIIGANSATYLPPNTTAGTNYYYCVISFPSISCTTITSAVVEVLIHADPIISLQPMANQAICFGTTLNQPLEIGYTGGYGTPSYQWSAVDNGNPIIIGQATNSTYLPPVFNVSSTFYYQAQLTLSGNGCDVQLSNLAEVIVAPVPNIDSVESFLYCNGDLSDLIEFNGTIANTTYYWENDNPAIGLAANGFGNIVPFTVTNMNNFGLTGNITVTPQVTIYNTVCSGTPAQFTIMVNPYQDVQDPQDLVLCHGTGVNGIQFFGTALMNNWTNDLPALGIPASGTGSIPAFLAVNNGTQPIVANLSVTPSFNAPTTCPGDIETFTITILPNPSVALSPATQSLCSGDVSTTINFTGVATSFDWTNTTPSIGLAANGSGNIPGFVTSATGSNTTATIEVTPVYTYAGQTCEGMFEQAQITVLPAPSVQPLPDIVVCNGDATGLISIIGNASELNWSSSNPSIGTANLGSGTIPSFNAINTGQNPVSTVITVTPVNYIGSFTCLAPTIDFSIIVNPTPTVNAILDQVLCANDNSPALMFSGNATNFTWTNSETSIGLAASGSNLIGSFITQNTLPSVLSATMNVTPEFTNAGYTCYGVPELFAIDVLPEPTINGVSPQVLCNGTATAPIDFVGNATNYTWINNNTSIGLAASGNGNITAFNTFAGSTNNVANIVITPQYTYNNTTCAGTPTTTQITVLPSPSINPIQDVVLCDNEASGLISISGTATSFDWNNSNPSIGLLASGTGSIGSFIASNSSSNPVIATITVTPQSALNNTTCLGNPEQFSITVNPTPVLNPLANQVLCSQGQSAPVNFFGGVQNNAISYSWLNSNPSIGLPSNGSGNIGAFTAQNNGPLNATAQIQVTPYYTNAGVSCPGQTQNFNFTIEPIPTIQYSQIAQSICSGATTNEVVISSPTPGVNISWAIVNPSMVIGGVSTLSGNGNIPTMTLSNTTNSSAQFNFQATATTPLLGCTGTGGLGTISVDPTPVLTPLNDLTLCSSDVLNVNLNANVLSTYEWSASANPNVSGQPSGTISSNLIFNTLQNTSSSLQTVTYTITPTSFPLGCVGPTESFNVEVVPSVVLISLLDTAICSGEQTAIQLQSNLPGVFEFAAISNINVQGENTNTQTGFFINDVLINNTAYNQTVNYEVELVSNPYNCPGIPQLITVTVHPALSITNVNPAQMCSGNPLNLTLAATENANFTWYGTQVANVGGVSATTQSVSLLNDILTLSPGITTPQMVNYTIGATSTVTGCDAQDLQLSVLVNPVPVVGAVPDEVFCAGELTDPYEWSLNGTGTNYVWTNTNSSIGLPLNGSGDIGAFYVNNPGPQTSSATITVTPQYVNSTTGFMCLGQDESFTITVEPTPTVAYDIASQTVCSGEPTAVVNISSTPANSNVTWQLVNPPVSVGGITNTSGTGSTLPSLTLINFTSSAQQVFFQASVSTPLNACQNNGPIGLILVNPEPVMNNINDMTICSGDVVSELLTASIPSTFVWGAQNNPNVNGESVGPINSNYILNTLQNTTSALQYVEYTITPTSNNGCIGVDLDFTVEVVPDIVLDTQITPLDTQICSNELTNIFLQTNYPATIIWHAIDNPNVSGETTTATVGNYISDILVNNTPFNQYVTYYIDMISSPNACAGIPELITVLVYPAIQLTNATTIDLCSEDALDLNLASTVNATYSWYALDNGLVQGESTTVQNSNVITDVLINASNQVQQVFYAVDVYSLNGQCNAYDLPITVNVIPLPTINNNDTVICSGEFTNIVLDPAIVPTTTIWNGVFNMDIDGETTANISGSYINDLLINTSGQDDTLIYEVQLYANGCWGHMDSILVTVYDQPVVDFSILTSPLCSEENIQFVNLSDPTFDFDWSFGDGGTSVDFLPIHIYDNSGTYQVMLVGTDPTNNCSAADSTTILVNKMPDASFYTMDTIGCGNLNATFYANYQATSEMVWDFGDGQTLAQVGNVTNYYGQAGCYDVTLTVTSPEGCVAQESYNDYVCVYENPIAFIGASPMSVNALNPTVQFSNSSQHAISYIWQMGDGGISYDDNPTYTYPMEGADYHVLMTAYNEVGCFDTASVDIHVYEELIFYVPNTFTPNDDEKNQTFYPILSQGMKRTYMEFYIYNRWGELVFESHDPAYGWDGTYGPDALDCPIGTYTWKLKLETLQTQEVLDFHGHVNLIR